MKIIKLSKFQHNTNGQCITVYICSLNNKIIYLTLLQDVNIINELKPDINGILVLNQTCNVWHDKRDWLNSDLLTATVQVSSGLSGWKMFTIKSSLLNYFIDNRR